MYVKSATCLSYSTLTIHSNRRYEISKVQNILILAATLRGSQPGVRSASPKTPKIQVFRGRTAPIFYGTQLDPDI